jgi:predicted enzyme related to lactoylglutathione lyase
MQFGATVLYVDDVSAVVDFYERAFDLEVRLRDEALGFAESETGDTV